jgi:hypothetical protein
LLVVEQQQKKKIAHHRLVSERSFLPRNRWESSMRVVLIPKKTYCNHTFSPLGRSPRSSLQATRVGKVFLVLLKKKEKNVPGDSMMFFFQSLAFFYLFKKTLKSYHIF